MKICYLAPANTVHSYRWIKYFAEKGHEIHWITFYPPNGSIPDGVHMYYLKSRLLKPLNFAMLVFQIRNLLSETKPDVFHLHSMALYGLGAFCGFHPLVATAWGSDVIEARGIRRKYVKSILSRADCITCDAYHMNDRMAGLGADPKKIVQINFGIDTKKFYPKPKNEELRKKLAFKNGPAIISLRSLYPVYDIPTLIHAVPLVLKDVPNAKFIVVGIGPEEKNLKNLVKQLNLEKSVCFISSINNNELSDYLTSVDVYVSTALSDAGISASTAEAMACGLPVVITNSGENGKWVKEGVNGFLIPVKDPAKLSEKVVYLLKNDHVRCEVGKKAREIIQEKNDYYVEMHKMEDIYHQLSRQQQS